MIESEFDSGDLYGLEACLRDLDEMLARKAEAVTDKAVRYALVKTFELTYELAVKAMRKYLVVTSLKTDEAATFDFQDLVRLADQDGLLEMGGLSGNSIAPIEPEQSIPMVKPSHSRSALR